MGVVAQAFSINHHLVAALSRVFFSHSMKGLSPSPLIFSDLPRDFALGLGARSTEIVVDVSEVEDEEDDSELSIDNAKYGFNERTTWDHLARVA